MNSGFQLFFRFWLCAILIFVASGVKIQFFRNYNYAGLIHESSSTEKCNNFPGNEKLKSYTTDTCLVLYLHSNCKSTTSVKILPSSNSAPAGQYFPLASFHVCNEEEGGSQLNVDITKYYEEDKPADVPAVLERYRQVCTCVNIPDYVQKLDKWSINGHHNNFIAYYEPDCFENNNTGTLFGAGQNEYVRNISDFTSSGFVTKSQNHILSIGPDKNSTYYNSSCQLYILLEKLASKVSVLQQSLKQAEFKVTVNPGNIGDMQTARRNETEELIRKNQAMERKLNDIEKIIEPKHGNVKDELIEIKREVEMKLDNTEKKIDGELEILKGENTEKFGEMEGKLEDVQKLMEARYKNLTHEFVGKVDGLEMKVNNTEKNTEDKFEKLMADLQLFL